MPYPLHLQTYTIGAQQLLLYVPEMHAVQNAYMAQRMTNAQLPFPYWAQVWPAAVAMARFLAQHTHYIKGKKVLELAAGLGLPSLLAASHAQQVTCTDYLPEAVAVAQRSVKENGFTNIECTVMDWNYLPQNLQPDVLLLSDVNYAPDQFETLYKVLHRFLQNGTTIILTTPQRLMARPFVERLLPWCTHKEQMEVTHQQQAVTITALVLQLL